MAPLAYNHFMSDKDRYRPALSDKEIVATTQQRLPDPFKTFTLTVDDDGDISVGEGDNLGSSKVPQNLRVVSQTVRYNSDGSAYVDVVVGWDAVSGAQSYEVRLVKL